MVEHIKLSWPVNAQSSKIFIDLDSVKNHSLKKKSRLKHFVS